MGNEPRNPLLWLIELFSVLTGAAFVISGVANGAAFWLTWGLNYFLIASPSDVIMSGFIFVAATLMLSIFVAPFTFGFGLGKKSRAKENEKYAAVDASIADQEQTLADAQSAGMEIEAIIRMQKAIYFAKRWRDERKKRTKIMDTFAVSISALSLASTAIIGAPTLIAAWNKAISTGPFWYETGLMTDGDARIGNQPCGLARVLWMGSSAAVLNCRDGVRVIHSLDGFQTRPRWGPKPEG